MNILRQFIAGLTLPSVIIPFWLSIASAVGRSDLMTLKFIHFVPLIWGIWNILYFAFLKNILPGSVSQRLFLAGGILGLLIAVYAVFLINLPRYLGFQGNLKYLPLLLAPIVYALLWRYVVSPINHLLNIHDE